MVHSFFTGLNENKTAVPEKTVFSDSSPVVTGTSAGRSGREGFVAAAPKAGVPAGVAEPKMLAGAGAVVVAAVVAVVAAAPKAGAVDAPKADGAEDALEAAAVKDKKLAKLKKI